jgi:chromosome segregation ATPase
MRSRRRRGGFLDFLGKQKEPSGVAPRPENKRSFFKPIIVKEAENVLKEVSRPGSTTAGDYVKKLDEAIASVKRRTEQANEDLSSSKARLKRLETIANRELLPSESRASLPSDIQSANLQMGDARSKVFENEQNLKTLENSLAELEKRRAEYGPVPPTGSSRRSRRRSKRKSSSRRR